MANVTLFVDYKSGSAKHYPDACDITISPAGVLTFSWKTEKDGAKKLITTVPFAVEENLP